MAYLAVHTVTLLLISAALLVYGLPAFFSSGSSSPNQPKYDQSFEWRTCQDFSGGFGWDERWHRDCISSLSSLRTGAICVAALMMIAQWLVVIHVWSWFGRKPRNGHNSVDLEKRLPLEKVQELRVLEKHDA